MSKEAVCDSKRTLKTRLNIKKQTKAITEPYGPTPQEKDNDALTPEERTKLEREKDKRERDEFVQRMLERDQKKTKQKVKTEEIDESEEAFRARIKLEDSLARGETVIDEDGEEMAV